MPSQHQNLKPLYNLYRMKTIGVVRRQHPTGITIEPSRDTVHYILYTYSHKEPNHELQPPKHIMYIIFETWCEEM